MSTSRLLALFALLTLAATACGDGGNGAGPREWRDLDVSVPPGWTVLDERVDLLFLANEDIRLDEGEEPPTLPEDRDSSDVVAVQFQANDRQAPDAYRALVADEGGEIEADERIEVGGLPATSLTFSWVTNNVPTRERVVFVPSRQITMTFQPIPIAGQRNGPDVFLAHTDEFDSILESIEFGRPVDE